jgi:hypothetical protein
MTPDVNSGHEYPHVALLPSAAITYRKATTACQEMNSFVLLASKENLDLPSLWNFLHPLPLALLHRPYRSA